MILVEQAEEIILNLVQPLDPDRDVEIVTLLAAAGRILAAPVTSVLDFPHWDNSAMDGYAVRYADVQTCSPEQPVMLEVIEEIPAGHQPQKTVQSGQAARILTGSVMPAGADTVVMQEETRREGDRVTLWSAPKPQAFVRHRAAFYQAGQPLLEPRLRLQAPELAVLAAAQCVQVKVYRQPRVAILSTGNELVRIDQPLRPGQIVDSNQYALAAAIAAAGAEPLMLGIVPDDPVCLRQAIAQALAADVVISSGGVSVGDYDYVDRILADLGATIHIRSVAIKPGKPLTVASFARNSCASTLYFGLPGNPVSALVTFWRFVQPALRKLAAGPLPYGPHFVEAVALQDLRSDGRRESYLWGRLHSALRPDAPGQFDLAGGSQSSGNLINLAGTNGLAVLAMGQTQVSAGERVRVLQIPL
jgi:molybdopterin molybdotransferase